MGDMLNDLFKAQPYMLCIVAGLILIGIGVVGSIKSYIDPGKYGRVGALIIGVILLTIGFVLYARLPAPSPQPQPGNGTLSSICTFTSGPETGTTRQLPETRLAAVGTPCEDANGDKGTIVPANTPLSRIKHPAPAPTPAPTQPTPAPTEADSRVCHFTSGPASGATHELPRAKPQPIGSPCHDLKGDSGTIVAANTPLTP